MKDHSFPEPPFASVAQNVTAVAYKHRSAMRHLISEYGSSCAAFGRALQANDNSASCLEQMNACNRRLERQLDDLVQLALSYFRQHGANPNVSEPDDF